MSEEPIDPFEIAAGKYICTHRIGKGGMGTVYKATQIALNRIVAVKILKEDLASDDEFRARFDQEAKIIAQLNHPNIVSIIDHVPYNHTYCIVMEYVDGVSFQSIIDAKAPLPDTQVASIGAQVARALKSAHDKGIVHRDVKPDNLLITSTGLVKVTDFGIARQDNSSLKTQTGVSLGTPKFMSPEQVIGRGIDSQSDLYALGVCLYFALTGHAPFDGDNPIAVATKHLYEKPEPITDFNKSCNAALINAVMTAMAKQKPDRFADGEEMAQALEASVGQSSQVYINTAGVTATTGVATPRHGTGSLTPTSTTLLRVTPVPGKQRKNASAAQNVGAIWPAIVAIMIVIGIVGASLMVQRSAISSDQSHQTSGKPAGNNPEVGAPSGTAGNGFPSLMYPEDKLSSDYNALVQQIETLCAAGQVAKSRQMLDDFRNTNKGFRVLEIEQRLDQLTAQLPVTVPDLHSLLAARRDRKSLAYAKAPSPNFALALAYATAARAMSAGIGAATANSSSDIAMLETQLKTGSFPLSDEEKTTMTQRLAQIHAAVISDSKTEIPADAEAVLTRMIQAEPARYATWVDLAQVYLRNGYPDDARVLLQYVERQSPPASEERKIAGQLNRTLDTQALPQAVK